MQPIRLVPTVAALALLLTSAAFSAEKPAPPAAASRPADTSAGAPKEPKAPQSFDLTAIDKTADPCVDFYEYACGNWKKDNPIPSDQVIWGRFNQLIERNNYLLYTELEKASNPAAQRTPLQKQYGDFFAACMNTTLTNEQGAKPIEPKLQQVAALQDKKQLAAFVADIQKNQLGNTFFDIGAQQDLKDSTKMIAGIHQGGLSLPDRDYYLETDDRMTKIRQQYTEYMITVFKLAGDTPEQAAEEAKNVLDIETALAKGSISRTELRDPEKRYHPMEVSALNGITPNFDWKLYFTSIDESQLTNLNVGMPDFFKAMDQVITSSSLPQLKSYLRLHIINGNAPWLSDNFYQAYFNLFSHELQGQDSPTPQWKRCSRLTDQNLGEAVGQDWVKQYFPPQSKADMEKLVAALKTSLAADIQTLPWMTDATKKEAEAKLELFRQKIGYPDKWKDYSSIKIDRTDLIGNLDHVATFDFNYDMDKIGKPVDEKEWGMTPPTVNAYYSSSMNDINFPAGILQPPFFDPNKDPAINFGAIGVVIGHEMTHGFDDQGSKFDGKGNLREWYTPDDRKQFVAKTDCEVSEYGNFESVPGAKLNGKLTLGENTADNGGLRIAYQALMSVMVPEGAATGKQIDGYTPQQRFFISYGQLWCQNSTDQVARQRVKTDPHSPGHWRVDGVVQNFDEFGKAFGCKKGQPMMPDNACRVW
jgi:putative endopeptidase